MFGFLNNKYEKFTSNDDSRIQRIFDAESKALTQINSTSESASAEIKKKSDDAVYQVNKSTNDATQQIIGKINEKYNEIEQKIPLIAKESVDKTVKQAVDTAIKNAEPAAKKMVYDVTGVYNYGKTNYNPTEGYANISTNMLTNYKLETTSSWFFLFFVVFVVGSVYGIYKFKYDNSHINELIDGFITDTPKSSQFKNIGIGLIRIAIICGVIMLCIVVFKTTAFKTNMNSKEALNILTTVAIIGVPIIGITMLTVENVDLMMRSFDNTIGYLLTKGDKMKECTEELFGGDKNYNDYSVIVTQLFEENFPYYLSCMKRDFVPTEKDKNLNRFKNIFLNEAYNDHIQDGEKLKKTDNKLHKLLEFVVNKRFISNMSWVAFSAIYVLYVCNLKLLQ